MVRSRLERMRVRVRVLTMTMCTSLWLLKDEASGDTAKGVGQGIGPGSPHEAADRLLRETFDVWQ
jgi:hypothetical protein